MKELFQHASTQGQFEMAGIVDMAEVVERDRFEVEVD